MESDRNGPPPIHPKCDGSLRCKFRHTRLCSVRDGARKSAHQGRASPWNAQDRARAWLLLMAVRATILGGNPSFLYSNRASRFVRWTVVATERAVMSPTTLCREKPKMSRLSSIRDRTRCFCWATPTERFALWKLRSLHIEFPS